MKLAAHLQRSRHQVYYFRIVIPKRLRPLLGVTEFKRSLGTKDPAEARRSAYILSARAARILKRLGQAMSNQDPNDPEIAALIAQINKNAPGGIKKFEVRVGPVTIKADPRIPGDVEGAQETVEHLIKGHPELLQGRAPGDAQPELQALFLDALRRTGTAAPQADEIRLSAGIRYYFERAQTQADNSKTLKDKRACLDTFLQWTKAPHDPFLSTIDSRLIDDFVQFLMTEGGGRNGARGHSAATVSKKLNFLSHFFNQMRRSGRLPKSYELPTTGVTPFGSGGRYAYQEDRRYLPFGAQELDTLFAPENMTSLRKPHEYWIPIIGLYTGARINEIAQLKLTDIKHIDGWWVFDFNDEEGNQQKNKNSVRVIPIHPAILQLGLLDYINEVRQLPDATRVFPYLHQKSNGFADVPSEAFTRYLSQLGLKQPRKSFHSFRSTLIQHLQEQAVDPELRHFYTGHAMDSVQLRHYAKREIPAVLRDQVVAKIAFLAVESRLDAIKRESGALAEVMRHEMGKRVRYDSADARRKAQGRPPLRSNRNK